RLSQLEEARTRTGLLLESLEGSGSRIRFETFETAEECRARVGEVFRRLLEIRWDWAGEPSHLAFAEWQLDAWPSCSGLPAPLPASRGCVRGAKNPFWKSRGIGARPEGFEFPTNCLEGVGRGRAFACVEIARLRPAACPPLPGPPRMGSCAIIGIEPGLSVAQ